jgi:outer membrane protein
MDAFELARHEDPALAGSRASLSAAEARHGQALAQLRPQLSASATGAWNHRDYETLNTPSSLPFTTPPEISSYPNGTAQLTLNQPLWRRSNFIAVTESLRASEQSQSELQAAVQDMAVRLTQAWFDLMLASDDIAAAEEKRAAGHLFWDQAQKAADIGLAGPEELEDAHAKYESAVAERMAAVTELDTARATLEEIIGTFEPFVPPELADGYVVPPPVAADLGGWLERVDTGPLVQAARDARLAADEEIRKQEAGHGLTVDIVGNITRNYQKQGNFPGQDGYDIRQRSIGLQASLPLYTGGALSAKVKEAVALRNKADQDLRAAARKARSTAEVAWSGWRSGCVRIEAARQSLHAARIALQVVESGSGKGLKFELDVVQARQNFAAAWRDLQKSRYDAVMSRLKLKAVAGELGEDDVRELHRNMTSRPPTAPVP